MYNLPEDQVAETGKLVEHHLYSAAPLLELSINTLGPLPEDESGMRYIILIVDNFSKFVGLYPLNSKSTLEFVKVFLSWVPKTLRSDGGSQSLHLTWPNHSRIPKSISTPSWYPTIRKQIQWQRGG